MEDLKLKFHEYNILVDLIIKPSVWNDLLIHKGSRISSWSLFLKQFIDV